jgi:hypothetical protein
MNRGENRPATMQGLAWWSRRSYGCCKQCSMFCQGPLELWKNIWVPPISSPLSKAASLESLSCNHKAQCLRTSLHKYASMNQTAPPISSCIYFSLTIQKFMVSQFKDFLYKSLSLCAKGAPYEICKSFFPRAMKSWQHRTETYLL